MSRLQAKSKPAKRPKIAAKKPRAKSSVSNRTKPQRKAKSPKTGAHQPVVETLTARPYVYLEKGHPPQTIEDLPWPVSYRTKLANFVKKGRGNLLFAGLSGSGKSEAARLVVRLMDLDGFWVDASDDATLEKLKNAKISALYPSFLNKRRGVILDEADSYGLKALQSLRGDTMDDPDATFIITCNEISKIPAAVRSRCEQFIFDEGDRELLQEIGSEQKRRAREILDKAGIEYSARDIVSSWSGTKGDFRGALRALENRVNDSERPDQSTGENEVIVFAPGDAPPLVPDLTLLAPKQRRTAELFYALKAEFQKYLVLPDGGAETLAIFVMHAYAHDAAAFSPILAITSPQRSCGKTETLEMLRIMIAGALSTVSITPAALFELAEEGTPLLIDEADRFLKPGSDLIQLLNGGVKRGAATVYRAGGKRYRVWCPKVIARIGHITPDTLASRCIDIRMKRALPTDQTVEIPFDQEDQYEDLHQQCEAWADASVRELRVAKPAMPPEFKGRLAQKWRALFAIADFAGHSVAQEVRTAAIAIESDGDIDEDQGTLLLEDIRRIFDSGDTSVFSSELANELRRLADRPWSLWSRTLELRIARILSSYGIRPENIRKNGRQRKGYQRWKFEDAFKRYLSVA